MSCALLLLRCAVGERNIAEYDTLIGVSGHAKKNGMCARPKRFICERFG